MRKQSWTKRDPIKNYFPLPNEIYDLELSRGAISVYSFLLRREDRKTYQCLLSYREIGEGVGMCVTTVRKYVAELEERSLIRTERTTVTTKDGRKHNGRLLYHILPIQLPSISTMSGRWTWPTWHWNSIRQSSAWPRWRERSVHPDADAGTGPHPSRRSQPVCHGYGGQAKVHHQQVERQS